MRNRLRCLAAVAALVAAACTGEPERNLRDVDLDEGPEATTAPAPEVASDAGRLAVIDGSGRLVSIAPNGSDALVLEESTPGTSLVQQPTWSPDGRRLAWVRVEVVDGEPTASLVTASGEGTERTEAPTEVAPFYLYWDPTSSRIAYLGTSSEAEIELGIVDVGAGGTEAVPLDAGSPFYLSWNPAGDHLLVHVGEDRLERLAIDGSLATVDARPGTFNAPVWTTDGRSFVYASRTGGGQQLVVHDVGRARGRELVPFEGGIRFVVNPDGSRVAFQVLAEGGEAGPLSVVDRDTGDVVEIADGTAPAFFWSPHDDKLLYLFPEEAADRVWLRWGVWDEESSFVTPRFLPTEEFGRNYLQFFDQYAQSMTLWAPDARAFTYAGTNEAGETGIWVVAASSDAEPVLISDGVFSAWSAA